MNTIKLDVLATIDSNWVITADKTHYLMSKTSKLTRRELDWTLRALIADGMVVINGNVADGCEGKGWDGPAHHLTDRGRLMLSTGRAI